MKTVNNWGLILASGLIFGAPSTSFALDLKQNFYVGGGLGLSQYDLSTFEDYANGDPDTTYKDEAEDVVFSVIAGWNFVDQFSVEFMYFDFGAWESTETELDSIDNDFVAKWVNEGQITGFGFSVRYDVAVASRLDAYARLGMLSWDMDLESTDTEYGADTVDRSTLSFDGTDILMTIGMKYALSDQLFLFGEFNALDSTLEKNFGDGDKIEEDLPVRSIMGGFQYYFSAPTRRRADGSEAKKRENRARDITACDPKFKDIGGILCEE